VLGCRHRERTVGVALVAYERVAVADLRALTAIYRKIIERYFA